jgi:HTH-type transcriptional regulator/antitoxin HigA
MELTAIKYTIIKNKDQYNQYCNQLETLLAMESSEAVQDEIDLLTLLIEKYDDEHNTFEESDPIVLLRSFMQDHHLKSQDIAEILMISKGYMSDILNYKKGLSKEVIRKLADYFKVRQEAFNRPYKLISSVNVHLRKASGMTSAKNLQYAGKK